MKTMKTIALSTYIKALQELQKDHGNDLPLYYACDNESEGNDNDFKEVIYLPGTMLLDQLNGDEVIIIN